MSVILRNVAVLASVGKITKSYLDLAQDMFQGSLEIKCQVLDCIQG